MRDKLYLMKPGFMNAGLGPFYCGDSVAVEGLLGFFPELREKIDLTYIAFPRPRTALVEVIGDNHQSVPVFILASDSPDIAEIDVRKSKGQRYIDNEKGIREYLSIRHGLPRSG